MMSLPVHFKGAVVVYSLGVVILLLASAPLARPQAEPFESDGFAPIRQEELNLKDNPAEPGAAAMILYRDVDVDGYGQATKQYYRIKIFNDEGKKYADVEIPVFKEDHVESIRARTIHPDGTVAEFEGKPFDKVVVKGKGIKIYEKTFTLPDVRTGSVIEYRYIRRWGEGISRGSYLDPTIIDHLGPLQADRWIIDDELFTRHAHFALSPLQLPIAWTADGLAAGQSPQRHADRTITLDVNSIPALVKEEYMPPEEAIERQVEFFYVPANMKSAEDAQQFWVDHAKKPAKQDDAFVGNHKAIREKVEAVVSGDDPPEIKLRKLYAEAQKIRNLSFETEKTATEEKREKLKDNKNAEDVLKHGYGYGYDITQFFIALARAGGFDAHAVLAVNRQTHIFNPYLVRWGQLDSDLVEVDLGGKKLYVDPATRFCPFGLLPWQETGVKGVRLDTDGGVIVTTTLPAGADAVIEREAQLKMDENGLSGQITLSFAGEEALGRRLDASESDEAAKKKSLEDEVKNLLPAGSTASLTKATGWDGSDAPLVAEFDVHLPFLGSTVGKRLLMPIAPFEGGRKNPFAHTSRTNPVYFPYPWQELDSITIELPKGYRVETMPAPKTLNEQFGQYEVSCESKGNTIVLHRKFVMDGIIFPTEYYPSLRAFYQNVGAEDGQQYVLRSTEVGQVQ